MTRAPRLGGALRARLERLGVVAAGPRGPRRRRAGSRSPSSAARSPGRRSRRGGRAAGPRRRRRARSSRPKPRSRRLGTSAESIRLKAPRGLNEPRVLQELELQRRAGRGRPNARARARPPGFAGPSRRSRRRRLDVEARPSSGVAGRVPSHGSHRRDMPAWRTHARRPFDTTSRGPQPDRHRVTADVEGVEVATDHWIGGERVASSDTFDDVSPIDETRHRRGRARRPAEDADRAVAGGPGRRFEVWGATLAEASAPRSCTAIADARRGAGPRARRGRDPRQRIAAALDAQLGHAARRAELPVLRRPARWSWRGGRRRV